jgi:CheY-like chemotaxis protein
VSDSDAAALAALMAPQEALPEEETETAAPGAQPPGCDVLIADDSGASRELLSAILRNFAGPLDIREARNGQEAVALWQQWRPRITLLDIDMPGLDGLSALQQLRTLDPEAFVAMVSGGSHGRHVLHQGSRREAVRQGRRQGRRGCRAGVPLAGERGGPEPRGR